MATQTEKGKLKRKLLKIQLKGLISYKEYLTAEFVYSADKKSRKKYSKYIEQQAVDTEKKIEKLAAKIKKK